MRVSIMSIAVVKGWEEILAPRAVDPRLHVMSRQVAGNYDAMHPGVDSRELGDVIRAATHFECRRKLMDLYANSSGIRLVMEGWYIGKDSRQEGYGGFLCWVVSEVRHSTTFPGYSVRRVSGRRTRWRRSCERVVDRHCLGRGIMAPKRPAPLPSRTASGRACTRIMTKEQGKAVLSAKHFKQSVAPEIQADIAKLEEGVWEEANRGIPEPEFDDLAGWIHDPGKTFGRLGLYQRAITYYWASKCLLAKLMTDQKQRGMVPAPMWDSHYNDSRLMHRKLDVLAYKLGIKFVAPEPALTAKAAARKGKQPQQASAQVP